MDDPRPTATQRPAPQEQTSWTTLGKALNPSEFIQRGKGSKPRSRHQGHTPGASNRITWSLVGAVVILYLLSLGFMVLREKNRTRAIIVKPPPKPAATSTVVRVVNRAMEASITSRIKDWWQVERLTEKYGEDHPPSRPKDVLREALDLYEKVPENAALLALLGRLYMDAGDPATAEYYLNKSLGSMPSSTGTQINLARALAAQNIWKEVRELTAWILEKNAYSDQALELMAEACTRLNDPAAAIPYYKRLINFNVGNMTYHNKLGLAHIQAGDLRQASMVFVEIIKQDKSQSTAYYNLAICQANMNRSTNALETLKSASDEFGHGFIKGWVDNEAFRAYTNEAAWQSFLAQVNSLETPTSGDVDTKRKP